jgi:hypothetical protein
LLVGLGLLPRPSRRFLRDLSLCAVVACLPDIDFLWGRHAMETHSLGAAILTGLVILAATRRPSLAGACAISWCSHVLFDWLGSDDFPPLGVMALWPFTNDFYFAHAYVFDAISRRYHLPNFWPHNIWAVVKEVLILAPPVAALAWWRRNEMRRP